MPEYIVARTEKDYSAASALFREYAEWLNIDLGFQNFQKELEQISIMYNEPDGGIILAKEDNEYIASVAVRRINDTTAELKRMYVKPSHQKKGIGQDLLDSAIELARRLGYRSIRLDTLKHMHSAIGLYIKNGFIEILPYYHNPNSSAVYFEKELD